MEKVYKTMRNAGVINIVIGSVIITAGVAAGVLAIISRACLKIHSCHLHAPLCGIFGPNSVSVAHYASFIRAKSPTKCDAQLTESNFQTRSSTALH